MAFGDQHAPDRGAFLTGLLGHVAQHILEEGFVHVAAGLGVGAEHRGVQTVRLDVDAHGFPNDVGERAYAHAGVARTGEREHVLAAEQRRQVARRADEQRERALGQDLPLDENLHDAVRNHRGAGRGLREHGHSREQRGGGLLGQTPGGEVERVDMHGDAVPGHAYVLPVEPRRAPQLYAFAVHQKCHRAELLAQLGVGLEREDRAVHVELRIRARVAAVCDREVEQLVAMRLDRLRHVLEQRAAFGEGQGAQGRAAQFAGVV